MNPNSKFLPTGRFNWDEMFRQAGRSLLVQNVKPRHETARNVFEEDEEQIMAAARSHGFVLVSSRKAKSGAFVKGKA